MERFMQKNYFTSAGWLLVLSCLVVGCGSGNSGDDSSEVKGPDRLIARDSGGDIIIPVSAFNETPIFDDWFFEVSGGGTNFNFYLYKPITYNSNTDKNYPLLIVLHGDNGYNDRRPKITPYPLRSGVFNEFVAEDDVTLLATGRDSLNSHVKDAFVIHPEIPYINRSDINSDPLGYWNPNSLNNIVNYLIAKYRIDTSRIYLTGASMGGGGTFYYAQTAPSKFAAIIPICNGLYEYYWRAVILQDMPIWLFHNYDDQTVKLHSSILPTVNQFMSINVMSTFPSTFPPDNEYTISYDSVGGPQAWVMGTNFVSGTFNFTLYPNGGHNAWDKTYKKEEVWDWLFSKTNVR